MSFDLVKAILGSIYQQFQSATKINHNLDNVLKQYYQKWSPSQYCAGETQIKDFTLLEGNEINQRKILYATSFKKATLENFNQQK